ncbi:hypothetical protein TVAG_217380 [Trichomonas vaginalis G3]|uniref:Uncharacterized protein n=1 Tax=Trichomonas vaginalis (strain ATCC PRA-98 / G3) TaxID=412133 RepID=A2EZC0_TRIV3|nr:hypothetical protein TVAGG3_0136530 [Trichomonas vaginalis G3]EAY02001.1 hypothetical protein TVAG_217380 [Trichomonas vaginalis G3]KAI5546444.1 hypothetical protein TVAGG3_0136530 [Trichomonas vaginalis G3]|eukprot:XP_001330481.1 hypothetical protein [Trichomonas vaginalis G3]
MDTRRSAIAKSAEHIVKELKIQSKENIKALSRISIWNSIFIDCPIIAETKIRDHFNNIIRRYLVGVTNTQRFLFELSVFMIDLPDIFCELIDHFPPPFAVAGRIAYRATINSLECKPADAEHKLQEAIRRDMVNPPDSLIEILADKKNGPRRLSEFVATIDRNSNIPKSVLEAILKCLPPPERMQFSIKYGVPPPKINLNLSSLPLPFEFLEAIVDIDGKETLEYLIDDNEYAM